MLIVSKHLGRACLFSITIALGGCVPSGSDPVNAVGSTEAAKSAATTSFPTVSPGEQCPSVRPAYDDIPEGLSLTPRADAEAEQLAFEAACTIAAPSALYERVTRELAALRAEFPAIRTLHASSEWEPFNG